jgi:hypothetical protein
MDTWMKPLRFDPVPALLSSNDEAKSYFARRDLLEEEVAPIDRIWRLPEVERIVRKQRPDGSWRHVGTEAAVYPSHHYSLFETFKRFRTLVERYEVTREHPAARRAAEFLLSCQATDGDIRGMLGNQYATYYTGDILALLVKAGYGDDPRVEKGFDWLLSMRQDDGGWTIPILTHRFDRKTIYALVSRYAEPVEPDRSKPSSHNWTDMALRAFATHPRYAKCKEAEAAGILLKSQFFRPDAYSSYGAASYWVRFQFWWPNLLTALDSLSRMGFARDDPDIVKGLEWFVDHQEPDGLWNVTYVAGKKIAENERNRERRLWVSLSVCRIFRRFYDR